MTYKLYYMFFTLFSYLSYVISSNSQFPPIGNIYKTTVKIPFVGKQYVEYKQFNNKNSYIYLAGLINLNCTMTINDIKYCDDNMYYFTFDNDIIENLKKFKCSINNPHYDLSNDIIIFNICLELFNYKKNIVLRNKKYLIT